MIEVWNPIGGVIFKLNWVLPNPARRLYDKLFGSRRVALLPPPRDKSFYGSYSRAINRDLFKVMFFSGVPLESPSNRYRIFNLREQLALKGIGSDWIWLPKAGGKDFWKRLAEFDIYVIFRASTHTLGPQVRGIVEFGKRLKRPVVYSIDDFVFDRRILPKISGFSDLGLEHKKFFEDVLLGTRDAILLCDYFLASTEPLMAQGKRLGRKSFLIRNGLNQKQIETSREASKKVRKNADEVVIGYLSGTKTHEKDWGVSSQAVLQVMEQNPRAKLLVGGYLDLPHEFDKFGKRTIKVPYVSWEKLPYKIAEMDINLAPLEPFNLFTDCKSELKYFEPALLKIPTIASPTEAFRFAIKNGDNGFLASNNSDWYKYLKMLVEDWALRERIGRNAYKHTLANYTPEAQAGKTREVLLAILSDALKKNGKK